MPGRFEDVTFAVNGLGRNIWQPASCARLGVISPFCDTDALDVLASLPTAKKPIIISRPDRVPSATNRLWGCFPAAVRSGRDHPLPGRVRPLARLVCQDENRRQSMRLYLTHHQIFA